MLTPHAQEIIGDYWYAFRSNRLCNVNILCIGQIVKTEWEHIEIVQQVFIGFKKVYDSVRRKDLCVILIEFVIHM